MNKEDIDITIKYQEQEVLKTFKKGLGLSSVEQEILVNYIDKLQKELNNSISKDKICEMIDKIIDKSCTYDDMYIIALEDFKEIIEKGDIK